MTRNNSSCKLRTLVFNCSVRQAPLYAVAFLAMLLFQPVYTLLNIRSRTRFSDMSNPDVYSSVCKDLRDSLLVNAPAAVLLLILALVAGISAFRYLHVKNQTDFFHALPIRRGQLFASRALTGILAVLPSYVIGVLLSCAVIAAHGYGEILSTPEIVSSIAAHAAGFMLVYAVAVLSAIVCGNTLVSLLVCGWFQLGILLGWVALDSLLYVLMPARTNSPAVSLWSSPLIDVFQLLRPLTEDTISYGVVGKQAAECLLAALVILALAYILNRMRASESTGMSLAFPVMQLPLKLYMMSVVGAYVGLFFEDMTGSWGMLFVGMTGGAFVTACVTEIVYDMDFHSLFCHWKSTVVYAVAAAVVLGVFALDVMGWNSKLPNRADIVSAQLVSDYTPWECTNNRWNQDWDYANFSHDMIQSLDVSSNTYRATYVSDSDPSDLLDITEVQKLREADNIDRVYASAQLGAQAMQHERGKISEKLSDCDEYGDSLYATYLVRFQLANGKTFERQYIMPTDTQELADNADAVRYSKEYLSTSTPEAVAQSKQDVAKSIDVYGCEASYSASKRIDNQQAIRAILDTLQKESLQRDKAYIDSHAPVYYLYVRGRQNMGLNGDEYLPTGDGDGDDMIMIPVYDYETQTIALLGKYVDAMPKTLRVDNIAKISVAKYIIDDGPQEFKDYTQAADIAKLLPALIPSGFANCMDQAVYHQAIKNCMSATVYTKDGQEILCECYADRTGGLVS